MASEAAECQQFKKEEQKLVDTFKMLAKKVLTNREETKRAESQKLSIANESDNEHDSWVQVSQRGSAKGNLGESHEGQDRMNGLKPLKFTV